MVSWSPRVADIGKSSGKVPDCSFIFAVLTGLGLSLSAASCGVWLWAAEHLKEVEKARAVFDSKGMSTKTVVQRTTTCRQKRVRACVLEGRSS